MKQSINQYGFERAFAEMGRENSYSYEGKKALFEYIEQYEDDTGKELELDVIALCGEFTEYKDLKEFQDNYGKEYKTLEDIEEETTVIPINDKSFIIQDF